MQPLRFITIILVMLAALVPIVSADYTPMDGEMNATYTFTGTFVDSVSLAVIPTVTVSDNLGFSTTTGSGTFSNTYDYGTYTFTSSAANYATTTTTVTIDNDTAMNISLVAAEGGSTTQYFTPHQVRFKCVNYQGEPIVGMSVTAIGVQTTLGSVDWILTMFGINLASTPITSTLMSGTTGNDGSIVFLMLESEKYKLNFVSAAHSINETRYYYPQEEQYTEIFWSEIPKPSSENVKHAFFNTTPNASYITLGISYNDSVSTTTALMFFIDNESGYRINTQNFGAISNVTVSSDVPFVAGGAYIWGFNATNTNYKEHISPAKVYLMESAQWLINPLKASNGDAFATTIYNYGAIAFIAIFALIFSRASIKFGAVWVGLMGALFKYIGWLETSWLLVSIALAFGVLLYLRYAEEEGGT